MKLAAESERIRGSSCAPASVCLLDRSIVRYMSGLGEALSLIALVAATLEYAILMRHREEWRDAVRWQEQLRESLVSAGRVNSVPARRWVDEGSRFRLVP